MEALADAACLLRLLDPYDAWLFWGAVDYGKTHDPQGLGGYEYILNQLRRLTTEEEATSR